MAELPVTALDPAAAGSASDPGAAARGGSAPAPGHPPGGGPRAVTLRFLAEPAHVNFGGKVHGGAVMKWIDQAGYTCAAGWTGEYCVTVYVGGIHFMRPIRVGELVEVRARVAHTGERSVHVAIDVHAGDPREGALERATICVIVFVPLDGDGRPKPVPPWSPETDRDRELQAYARRLIEFRKALESEARGHRMLGD